MNLEEAYKNLFHRAAMSRFSLDYISETVEFRDSCLEQNESTLANKTEILLSMIYFVNDLPEKSLVIDLEVMKKLTADDPTYGQALLSSSKTSVYLNRTDEVAPFALKFFKEIPTIFSLSIPLLYWYCVHYTIEEKDEAIITSTTDVAISSIGLELKSELPITEKIEILYAEMDRAGKDLHTLKVNVQKDNEQEKKVLIDKYIEQEPLAYYKNIIRSEQRYHP